LAPHVRVDEIRLDGFDEALIFTVRQRAFFDADLLILRQVAKEKSRKRGFGGIAVVHVVAGATHQIVTPVRNLLPLALPDTLPRRPATAVESGARECAMWRR